MAERSVRSAIPKAFGLEAATRTPSSRAKNLVVIRKAM
jgi:hypothetical protein